jgi:low temperature requirement protein LtrA
VDSPSLPTQSGFSPAAGEEGKRVSWVELYLDLVFVLAVGRLAHLIVAEPETRSVWIALGLFVTLWWTWVGFAVLYNRHGADLPAQRLLFLAGSVPAGVAAVAIDPTFTGDVAVFAASMAVTRLVLAAISGVGAGRTDLLRLQIARACVISAGLFAISIAVPEPFRYALWALAILNESRAMLREDREAARRVRRDGDLASLAPADPAEALDAHHFAERFGLFLIILLGEVLVEAGQGSVAAQTVAAMLLAAALWWLYFDSAAELNLKVLELSGGSPTMARAIFAAGHMLPAFALLLIASGVGLLIEGEAPAIAYWLACVGAGIYLAGTRAFLVSGRGVPGAVRVLVLVATFFLGRLHSVLSPHEYLWLIAAWMVVCAALTTRVDVTAFIGERRVRS